MSKKRKFHQKKGLKAFNNKSIPIGALILLYICCIGMIALNAPPLLFYLHIQKAVGTVSEINLKTAKINFEDNNRIKKSIRFDIKYQQPQILNGADIEVLYHKKKSDVIVVPKFQGNQPYLINLILVLASLYVMNFSLSDYINGIRKV